MKKWNIVLRLASIAIPEKVDLALFIVKSMTGNEYFPKPSPELKTIFKIAHELQLAYTNSRDSGREQTAEMYAKEFELDIELIALSNYVQDIANRDNEIGDVIIFSAGMDVKREKGGRSRTFTVVNTSISGRVKLQAKAEGRASYLWEYSLDQENWTTGNITVQSSTVISNLTPGERYYFRVAVIKEEQGPWQGPVNTIVT